MVDLGVRMYQIIRTLLVLAYFVGSIRNFGSIIFYIDMILFISDLVLLRFCF